jgi:flagellar basal body-associated protein FliL
MNKKIIIPIVVVVVAVAAFAGYSVAKPKSHTKIKINGTTYILPKQFTLNLSSGQYATLTVALLLPPSQSVGTTNPTNPPPTGFGSLTEEAEIRAIITNDVTNQPASSLLVAKDRQALEAKILSDINAQTDTKVTQIYFTDLAVQ